ncbi:hypothetical protein E4U56_006492 [Claviceps arundinis]|uniref:Uncharacterized protein n=1 Tax=Claviceps arundinis TaxID=1623583 RepID=A0A9P7ML28_9HYPO|nr:hypothetical protein E4U56_006492 [Claviceps arundinis]
MSDYVIDYYTNDEKTSYEMANNKKNDKPQSADAPQPPDVPGTDPGVEQKATGEAAATVRGGRGQERVPPPFRSGKNKERSPRRDYRCWYDR